MLPGFARTLVPSLIRPLRPASHRGAAARLLRLVISALVAAAFVATPIPSDAAQGSIPSHRTSNHHPQNQLRVPAPVKVRVALAISDDYRRGQEPG